MKKHSHTFIRNVNSTLYIFLALLCFGLFSESFADTLAQEKDLIYISVSATEIGGMIYKDKKGKPQGRFVDILRAAEKNSPLRFNIHIMPWARALVEVKNNRIDAIMPALYNDERAQYLVYPQKNLFTFGHNVLIKRSSDTSEFNGFLTIGKDKLIGKVRASILGSEFDQAERSGQITVFETMNLEQAIDMLSKHRLDFVASDVDIAGSELNRLNLSDQFTLIPLERIQAKSYLSFSKKFAEKHNVESIIELILQANIGNSSVKIN